MTGPVNPPPPPGSQFGAATPPPPPPGGPAYQAPPPPPAGGAAPPPPPQGPPPAATGGGGGKKSGLLIGGIASAMILGIAGAGVGAYLWLAGGGPQPADAMPDTVDVYVRFDGDPSASQKVEIYRLLQEIPELKDVLDEHDDIRESIVDAALESCEGVGWDDVEPWLGNRFGLGIDLDLPEDPRALETMPDDELFSQHLKIYFTAQVENESDAEEGIEEIFDACDAPEDLRPGIAVQDGFALIAYNQDLADEAVAAAADAPLADRAEFTDAMDKLGDPGIVSAWVSADPFVELIDAYGAELFGDLPPADIGLPTEDDWPGSNDSGFGTEPEDDWAGHDPGTSASLVVPAMTPADPEDDQDPRAEESPAPPIEEPVTPDPFGHDDDPWADPFGDDPFGNDPWGTDPYGTYPVCSSDEDVFETISDIYAQSFEGIESFAFALRAQDSALELIATMVYDENVDLDSTSALGDLPEDTVFGMTMASVPPAWQIDADLMLDMIAAESCSSADQIRQEISMYTPLDFDSDWDTLQNSAWLFYLGSKNLDQIDAMGYGLDIADFDFAGALLSEDGAATELVNRIADWVEAEGGISLNVADLAGGSAIGSNPEAAEALDGNGGLGDTDAFGQVIPESDIHGGVFVNLDTIVSTVEQAGGPSEFTENLDPLSALGLSWWADGDALMFSLRLGFDN